MHHFWCKWCAFLCFGPHQRMCAHLRMTELNSARFRSLPCFAHYPGYPGTLPCCLLHASSSIIASLVRVYLLMSPLSCYALASTYPRCWTHFCSLPLIAVLRTLPGVLRHAALLPVACQEHYYCLSCACISAPIAQPLLCPCKHLPSLLDPFLLASAHCRASYTVRGTQGTLPCCPLHARSIIIASLVRVYLLRSLSPCYALVGTDPYVSLSQVLWHASKGNGDKMTALNSCVLATKGPPEILFALP
jgi:hypothetical protein